MAGIAALAGCGPGGQSERQVAENDVGAVLGQAELRPGLWEMTSVIVSVSQVGLPHEIAERMKGPRRTVHHCITPAQAARTDRNFLPAAGGGRCSDETFEMRSGRIVGAATCRDEDGAETRLKRIGRFAAERYELTTEIETSGIGPGRVMTLVTRQSGSRVGDCPLGGEERK